MAEMLKYSYTKEIDVTVQFRYGLYVFIGLGDRL